MSGSRSPSLSRRGSSGGIRACRGVGRLRHGWAGLPCAAWRARGGQMW
ncbi:hypothetical protein [Anaerolinea sp.]|nr:hypothetical protein [Anaerolinea sp.]